MQVQTPATHEPEQQSSVLAHRPPFGRQQVVSAVLQASPAQQVPPSAPLQFDPTQGQAATHEPAVQLPEQQSENVEQKSLSS